MATETKKLKIKLVRGISAADKKQQKVLLALGLKKTGREVEHNASPTILGMINKVSHLVEVN
jgi:large subunit ribosomal protein L30